MKLKILIIFYLLAIYGKKLFFGNYFIIKPKISIFIPVFNKKKYLINSINSIQKQSIKNLEVIAINDYSTDDSLALLKYLSKKDSRIKIINNDRNHGLLYSRAMGIINSTGEYLMNLDPDDELLGENDLEYLYQISIKSKVDFVSFGFKTKNKYLKSCSSYNQIFKQPLLFLSVFNKNYYLKDLLIWNKFVKRELFIKAFQKFKNHIYKEKWNYHEDNIWSVLIHKYANSMICEKKKVYKYNYHSDSLMHKKEIIEIKNYIYKEKMIQYLKDGDLMNNNIVNDYFKSFLRSNKKIKTLKNKNNKFKNRFIKIINICIQLKKCSNYLKKSIKKIITTKF